MTLSLVRVLVVEDEPVMREFIVNSLRRLGIQHIETATDGASALQTMIHFRPELVLTDIHMQPMDGIAFVQQMRKHSNPVVKAMKVIFLSADSSMDTLDKALPLGTFGYIVKPPRLETLETRIEQALKAA